MFSISLVAQTVTATLSGTVQDVQGAVIGNVSMLVRNTDTGAARKLQTDQAGRFEANALQPGPYSVLAEVSGFAPKTLTGITLNVGDVKDLPIVLAVGGASESISVIASESNLQTQTSSNGALIDNKQVVELPLANRQFYSLALLSPAAFQPAQNSTLGFRGGINIAGASEISNQFTFNGIFDNDMGVAQPSYRPSVETIQEFRLLTGVYSAEYGRMSGGQVVIISKAGTNNFHGSIYEFLRNEYTDARPYFTAPGAKKPSFKQNTFGGTVGGPIWRNKTFFFAGYEGQRIRQAVTAQATVPTTDMLNGIFNTGQTLYDPSTGQPLTPVTPGTKIYNLATALPGSGAFHFASTGGQAGQAIAKFGFPAPTFATAAGTVPQNNYAFQETRTENMNEFTVRVDHKVSEKDSLSGSFNLFKDPAFEPSNSLCSSYVLPNFGCYTNQISTLINLTYDRIISPNLVNDLRLGYQRLQQPRVQQDSTTIGANYPGLPGGPYFTQAGYANNLGLPNVTFGNGYSTIGGATNLPQNRWDSHYQIADTATWSHGAHTVKLGADLLLARSINIITSSGRGAFSINDGNIQSLNAKTSTPHLGSAGDSIADLLLGAAYSSTVGTTAGTVYLNFQGYDAFLQDDWKIRPNLTLNLGVRYEMDVPVYSPHNTVSTFDLASQTFIAAGNGNFTHLYNYDYNNVAPRLGFSWQPYNDDKTVVKGATGIFYNQPLLYNQFLTDGTQYPFRLVQTLTSQASSPATNTLNTISLNNPFSVPNVPPSVPCTTGAQTGCSPLLSPLNIQSRYATPELMEWSLGVQQSFGRSLVFETTYFGSKGTKLPLSIAVNTINPATFTGTAGSQTFRPYKNFSGVSSQDTRSNSEFHSLQNSLKQSYNNGVTFILAYTWSKSIDGGGGIGSGSNSSGTPQNPYDLRSERSLSDFDVRHRIVFSPVVELPFGRNKLFFQGGPAAAIFGGFQISGIFSFQTGRPFTVIDASSNTSTLFGGGDRPNQVGDPNAAVNPVTGARTHTVAQWFNTAAFASNGTLHFGSARRNIIQGPHYTNLDLTLARTFHIFERFNGQIRAESFNLLNHPNFFNPLTAGTQFGANGFGAITQAQNPRDLQGSLRILF